MGNFRIVNAGKNRKKTHIKALIFGDSGAGKSYLSATAPNPLILLTEMNGQASIAASNPKADIIHIESANMLAAVLRDIDENPEDYKKYDSVIIDSLTETQRLLKDRILSRKSNGSGFQIQDWGRMAEDMRALVRRIRNLKKHVVCICLMETETEESTGIRHIRPAFEGKKTGAEIAQFFSVVGFLYPHAEENTENTQQGSKIVRSLMLEGPARVMCKPCGGATGVITNPNITELFAKITAS